MYLLVYAIFLLIIAGLAFLVAYNFLRYRYKNDKVPALLTLFAAAMITSVGATVSLYLITVSGSSAVEQLLEIQAN